MKFKKESVWILLAIVAAPFYFVCRDTIEVENGMVHAYKTTWWCKRSLVKSLDASCVGEVRKKLHAVGSSSRCEIELFDNHGQLFWVQTYQGFDKLDRCCQDEVALRRAIKIGSVFSATYCKSGAWALLSIVISLITWYYKRAWRLERKRQLRGGPRSAQKSEAIKFSSSQTVQYKLRRSNCKDGDGP